MFNYGNKHKVAQRARWCESAKSYTLTWYSGNLQQLRICPKIPTDGRFAEHLHLQLFCEKGMRSHCENVLQAHKEEQKKSLKPEESG